MKQLDPSSIKFIQDRDSALAVLRDAAKWLEESGKNPTEWWQTQNMNKDYFSTMTKPEEFYAALIEDKPAAAMVLQNYDRFGGWKLLDKDKEQPALYVHWLAVTREFAGMDLPKVMLNFAKNESKKRGFKYVRLDTNSANHKLRQIYENLDFTLMKDHDGVVYYQKPLT